MDNHVSMADIAEQAGVSVSTVSHVLNKTRYVSPEITERVERIMAETGYRQNMLARAMRQGKTNTIGIVIPSIAAGEFYSVALNAIEKRMSGEGYHMIIHASGNDAKQEQAAIRHLLGWNVDGMIITPSNPDYDYSQIPCPVVLMDRESNIKSVSGFYIDNYTVSCQAIRHFLENGHRKIAFLSSRPYFSRTVNRLKGYRDTLAEAGIPYREEYVRCAGLVSNEKMGEEMARYLINETDVTAALICASPLTVGTMRYLNANAIPVPDRLSIISFSNYTWMPLCSPPLVGIAQPNREIGEQVAERMLQLLRDPDDKEAVSKWLPCTLMPGSSVKNLNGSAI